MRTTHKNYNIEIRFGRFSLKLGMLGWLVILFGLIVSPSKFLHANETLDFDTQIMPLFSRLGCNAADCHGASGGRAGFSLSLFGSDPATDHDQIVRERLGRRVSLKNPSGSLLLLKGTESLDHEGGQRINPDSPEYELLRLWIEQGAPRLLSRRLIAIRVVAERSELHVGQSTRIKVLADFEIGKPRVDSPLKTIEQDVTELVVYQHDEGIDLQSSEVVLAKRPGQHNLMVRFLDQVAVLQLNVPFDQLDVQTTEISSIGVFNDSGALGIDRTITAQLTRLGLKGTAIANDATLVRRLYLDLVGELPDPIVVAKYVESKATNKYPKLVEELLMDERFSRLWTFHLAEWMRVESDPLSEPVAQAYFDWIAGELSGEAAISNLANKSLTATGNAEENGAVGFLTLTKDPRMTAELATNTWMGVRISCANCHNHPLDHWTRDDYFSWAAFFSGLRRENRIHWVESSAFINPLTRQPARPKLDGIMLAETEDPRQKLAEWLTSESNPYFYRVTANRIWAILMGVGEVEPVDDFRISNPPSNEALLDHLSQTFQKQQTQMRPFIRSIVLSKAYRRAVGEGVVSPKDRFHWRRLENPLSPPVLLGAIEQVTSSNGKSRLADYLATLRIGQSIDLRDFSPCDRSMTCSPTSSLRDRTGGLATNLRMLNGETINQRIIAPHGFLQTVILDEKSPFSDQQILEQIFQRAYGRNPQPPENEYWLQIAKQAITLKQRRSFWQDIIWAVVNSREFATNH